MGINLLELNSPNILFVDHTIFLKAVKWYGKINEVFISSLFNKNNLS